MITTATLPLTVREARAEELLDWNTLVRRFDNHRVTHLRCWLESLASSGCGYPRYLVFEKDGDIVGALPGLLSDVGGIRLFGSPREGWQTVSMGPAFDPARVGVGELMGAAVPFLERYYDVAHVEMMHTSLDGEQMRAAGFEGEPIFTYRAPLTPGNEAATLKRLKDSARRNIKRAERLGITVRTETDESFVDRHFDQLVEVYARNGTAIPFTRERVRECFRHLGQGGRLIALSAWLPDNRTCIATSMFFVEGKELCLWMWAHSDHYRWYRATELMTWEAMKRAMAQGCETMDFMGRGEFKTKFGAEPDETKWRWMRSRSRWLAAAREAARKVYHVRGAIRGMRLKAAAARAARKRDRLAAPAVVLGDIDLVRALALAKVPSVVLARPGAPTRFSRATAGAIDWIDPWERGDELVDRLVRWGFEQPEPPVLFYQDDRALLLASRHRDTLRKAFRYVIPDQQLVEQLVDKQQFQQLARRHSLPVPLARSFLPAREDAPQDLPFPVIVKPLTRRNDRWTPVAGGGKALRFDTPGDLRDAWPKLAELGARVLVQEHIPGPESQIESYHVYVDEQHHVVADFTGRKIRTFPAAYGDSTALEITDAYDVTELGRQVVKKLRLQGVAKLDFKRAPDGQLLLLEINPRFTLWNHLGAVAGVNIPALVHGDLTGRPRPVAAPVRAGVQWCKVWSDRAAARAGGISLLRWIPWALGCEAKSAFAWDDPMPLVRGALWRWFGGNSRPLPAPVGARLVPSSAGAR